MNSSQDQNKRDQKLFNKQDKLTPSNQNTLSNKPPPRKSTRRIVQTQKKLTYVDKQNSAIIKQEEKLLYQAIKNSVLETKNTNDNL